MALTYDDVHRMMALDVFEHKTHIDGKCPYRFTMPGIMIGGGDDVTVDFDRERRQWRMVQEDPDDSNLRWEVWGDSQVECVVALISLRATGKLPTFAADAAEKEQS